MNITRRKIQLVIEDFLAQPDEDYLCSASPTFREWWHDAATHNQLHKLAADFKHETALTDIDTAHDLGRADNASLPWSLLFYLKPFKSLELHRSTRLQFLVWLLQNYNRNTTDATPA